MTKLLKYTHDIEANKIQATIKYTIQGRTHEIKVEVAVADLLNMSSSWGVSVLCTKLSELTGMVVTV